MQALMMDLFWFILTFMSSRHPSFWMHHWWICWRWSLRGIHL